MALGARLSRYRDLARFAAKYRNADFVVQAGLDPALPSPSSTDADAEESSPGISKPLGPTFIKLGQLLSTRADLLPPAYLEALARLQDDVEPFPFAEVERIVQEELGVRLSKAFESNSTQSRSPRRRSARCTAPCCAAAARSRSRCSGRASASAC